jgi:hypothetical protein
MMRSGAESIRDIDRNGCISGRRVDAPGRLIIVATAIVMASLVTEAGRARSRPAVHARPSFGARATPQRLRKPGDDPQGSAIGRRHAAV